MNESHHPHETVDIPANPADSLDAGQAARSGRSTEAWQSSLSEMRPVLLREAEGESTHVLKPNSDAMPQKSETGDRYHLSGEIARGGMGAVLLGRDVDLGRDLAVKVLLEKFANQPAIARRFIEEAQIGGQLQHPGVVPVYDIGRFGDRPFFTMKLVKGKTLAGLLSERTDAAADLPRFLSIAHQVAQTLAYAHAKGVIHRDLKPANIMVGAFGEVQVMDWGLAKVLAEGGIANEAQSDPTNERPEDVTTIRTARGTDSAGSSRTETEAGSMLGTPAYMPPEQANGDIAHLNRRADVFGLGAILCEILTGEPPYVGRSREEVRCKAADGDLTDAFARLDTCGADAELIALTRTCLAPAAIDRPRDAQAVAEALTAYLDGVQARLHKAELAEAESRARAIEESKRRRLTLALASTVCVALTLGGGGWLWVQADRDARQAQLARDVNEAINKATALREQAKSASVGGALLFAQAREQTQRALALVANGPADAALKQQVQQLQSELDEEEKDRNLLAALDEARLSQAEIVAGENRFAEERAIPLFRLALAAYGMPAGEGEPAVIAARIRQRPVAVREAVLAALDEWDFLASNAKLQVVEPNKEWLRAVAAAIEPVEGWTQEFRLAASIMHVANQRMALEKLATSADVSKLPAQSLNHLARCLQSVGGAENAAAQLLRRTWLQYPADFWVNYNLGMMLRKVTPPELHEAVRFLTAAVALRPNSEGAHNALGIVLMDTGQVDEAIASYTRAIELEPELANTHFNLGIALQRQGRADEAIASYMRATELEPKLTNAHSNLGNVLMGQGQVDEAISSYMRAIEADPKNANAYANLGNALTDKGQVDEAIASYMRAIKVDPKHAKAYYNLGNALHGKGHVDEAIVSYKRAIELDPKNVNVHNNLGTALMAKGQVDEALASFKQAIETDPKHVNAHKNLANALQGKGRVDESIASYKQAIKLDPNNASAHFNLGNALLGKGQVDDAIASFKQGIEINPKHVSAHVNLGIALKDTGQMDDAIASFKRAIELDPQHVAAHGYLGDILFSIKHDYDEAVVCYRKTIELEPHRAVAHFRLGIALMKTGQVDEAIASLRRSIELKPQDADAHFELGNALMDKGQLGEAIASFKQAIEINPQDGMAHTNLGNALHTKGQVDDAIASYKRALELEPKLAAAHIYLGEALMDKGELDEAIANYKRAIDINPQKALVHVSLGYAQHSKGQVDEAIASYKRAIELDPKLVTAHLNLGIVLMNKGQMEEAIACFNRAIEINPQDALVRYNLARAERLAAISDKFLAFERGGYTPATTIERLDMIEWCRIKKLYRAAAGLYATGFDADPKLADDIQGPHLHDAACYAAMAAAGLGQDAARLDDKDRAQLRQQALDWLRANLTAYTKLLESGPPATRTLVQQKLRHCQEDADLAGIRDVAVLSKLPAEEQKAFKQLWSDVTALLKKAEPPATNTSKP